jgi:hypothetical protein
MAINCIMQRKFMSFCYIMPRSDLNIRCMIQWRVINVHCNIQQSDLTIRSIMQRVMMTIRCTLQQRVYKNMNIFPNLKPNLKLFS